MNLVNRVNAPPFRDPPAAGPAWAAAAMPTQEADPSGRSARGRDDATNQIPAWLNEPASPASELGEPSGRTTCGDVNKRELPAGMGDEQRGTGDVSRLLGQAGPPPTAVIDAVRCLG